MSTSNFTRLTTEQVTVWSRDLWRLARNMAFTSGFLGTGPNAMIQHITELTKTQKGTRAVMTLVPDLTGDGVAGDRRLKGNEESIPAYDKVIRVDQLRNANISEGRIAEQKSIVRFRETSRDVLAYWLADRMDQLAFLTLSGRAYSLKNNSATRTGSDLINLEFSADVAAPTSYRALRWDAANSTLVTNGATSAVTAADMPSWAMFVQAKAYAKEHYIRGIRSSGNREFYHAFLTPTAMSKLKLDPQYLRALEFASKRGSDNGLFTGEAVDVDGIVLHEFRHVYNTSGSASGSKWGAASDVDGCQILLCGAQAMGMADLGIPYWVEEDDDFQNQQAISVGKIFGFLKPQFPALYGAEAGTTQDFGVVSIYVAQ